MPVFEFAGFRLDSVRRHLISHGKVVSLAPKAIDVLEFLVARPGETVDKDELMRAVWGPTVVEENTLARNILLVRKALGETAGDNKFIITVAGRGYRFVCPVAIRTQTESPLAPGNSRRRMAAAVAAGLILVAGAGYGYRKLGVRGSLPPFAAGEAEHATKNGGVLKVALSLDGRTLAFAAGFSSLQGLYTRDLVTGEERELVKPTGLHFMGLTPSPDGSSIYFVARQSGEATGRLYRVGLGGAQPEELFGNVESPVSFAPDGRIVYAREHGAAAESQLIVSRPDGSQTRTLASARLPQYLDYPAWSPDGKWIVATRIGHPANRLLVFDAETGTSRQLGADWGFAMYPRWMPDGQHLVVAARAVGAKPRQLWSVSFPDGVASAVTRDLDEYFDVSLSRDGRSLIAVNRKMLTSLWAGPAAEPGAAQRVASGLDENSEVVWTPNSRLVFSLMAQGRRELWQMRLDGSEKLRWPLLEGSNYLPSLCRNKGEIIFVNTHDPGTSLGMSDLDGKNVRRLTDLGGWHNPQCSPNGEWITYVNYTKPGLPLIRRQLKAGSETVLSHERTAVGAISPDGAWVAQLTERPRMIRILPANGGEPLRSFSLPASTEVLPAAVRWTPDGKGVAYVDRSRGGNVWIQAVNGGPPRQYTDLRQESILFFDWSPEGKQFASVRLVSVQEAVRIREPNTH